MDKKIKAFAFAYFNYDGICYGSIAKTPEESKGKILERYFEWRFDYDTNLDERWKELEAYGEIKEIEISIKQESN